MQKKKRPYNYRKEKRERSKKRKQETSQQGNSKQKKGTPSTKGKGKQKAEVNESETMDANKCPICDMKWEDNDGENGEWLGCECGQWLHKTCIDYKLENPGDSAKKENQTSKSE